MSQPISIIANGTVKVPVPRGRSFTLAMRGGFDSGTTKVQWWDGTQWNDYATAAISLSAAGEKEGKNVGSANEILLVTTGVASASNITAVVNVVPVTGQLA